jgi:hypothetical protein
MTFAPEIGMKEAIAALEQSVVVTVHEIQKEMLAVSKPGASPGEIVGRMARVRGFLSVLEFRVGDLTDAAKAGRP